MSEPSKFVIRGATILWPSIFTPSVLDRGEDPKYRCSFVLPEGFVPPKWVYIKTTDGKYGLPVGTRFVSAQSLKPMPIFGVPEPLIRLAANTMQSPDKALHRARADVVLSSWESSKGSVYLIADAILVTGELALPTFETYRGDLT